MLAYDKFPRDDIRQMGIAYTSVEEMLPRCDIVTLHCPLTPETHHLMDVRRIAILKPVFMLINVSRGGLCDRQAIECVVVCLLYCSASCTQSAS